MEAESAIKAIIEQFSKHNLNELELSLPDFELRLVKDSPIYVNQNPNLETNFEIKEVAKEIGNLAAKQTASPVEKGETIRANLVGTYYSQPSEDAPPFVQVGQKVEKGQPMCIIEAMKIMNELCAPYDLIVKEICCVSGTMIEFDQVLFEVEKC